MVGRSDKGEDGGRDSCRRLAFGDGGAGCDCDGGGKSRRDGGSSRDGFAAQRSSACWARYLSWDCRRRSDCCSWMVGGEGRVWRSH